MLARGRLAVLGKPSRARLCVLLVLLLLAAAWTLVWFTSGSVTHVPTAVVTGPDGTTVETKAVSRIPRSAAARQYGHEVPVFFIGSDGARTRRLQLINGGSAPTATLVREVPATVEWQGSSYAVRTGLYTIMADGGVWNPGEGQTVEITAQVVYELGDGTGLMERCRWFWRRAGAIWR